MEILRWDDKCGGSLRGSHESKRCADLYPPVALGYVLGGWTEIKEHSDSESIR